MKRSDAVRPQTTAGWLVGCLRESILTGKLPAGTRIRQEQLAAEYSTSRMPVREALIALDTEGLVVLLPNQRAVVASLDADDAVELFEIRASLESLAIRRSAPLLSEQQRQEAIDALAALEAALPEEYLAAHRAFHLSLYAAAGKRMLRLIVQQFDAADRYLRAEATLLSITEADRSEHRLLLDLVLAKNTKACISLIRSHVGEAGYDIAKALKQSKKLEDEVPPESWAAK